MELFAAPRSSTDEFVSPTRSVWVETDHEEETIVTESDTILDLEPPAGQLKTLLSGVTDDQLSARTPCESFTVGDLLDHLMGLTIAFTMAATMSTGAADCRCNSTSWWPPGGIPRPGTG